MGRARRRGKFIPKLPSARLADKDTGTAELEEIVFGRRPQPARGRRTQVARKLGDTKAAAPEAVGEKRKAALSGVQPRVGPGEARPAWTDPDDATLQVDLTARHARLKLRRSSVECKVTGDEYEHRLRESFVKLHGHARWAEEQAAVGSDTEDEEEVATSAKLVTEDSSGMLKPTEISISRRMVVPLGLSKRAGTAVIQAFQFHPSSDMFLTVGLDKRLRLFAVEGEEISKVSSHFFTNFPIMEASFTPSGDRVLLTGIDHKLWSLDVHTGEPLIVRPFTAQSHRRFFNLAVGPHPTEAPGLRSSQVFAVTGDAGTVVLCDVATQQPIRTLRMSSWGSAAVFSTSRDSLFTADEERNIYEWDLGTGRCLQRFTEPCAHRHGNGLPELAHGQDTAR